MQAAQSMVKHKSRLEREKEVAEQQRKVEEAAQAQRAKRKVVHTPGSWAKQVWIPALLHGLSGWMHKHTIAFVYHLELQ